MRKLDGPRREPVCFRGSAFLKQGLQSFADAPFFDEVAGVRF